MRARAFALASMLSLLVALAASPVGAQDTPPDPSAGPEAGPTAPVEAAVTGIRAMTTGYYHSCALLNSGRVRCSGYNSYGQLGDGTDDDRTTSVLVRNASDSGPLTGVAQIAAGEEHTCALLTNKQVRCWGYNSEGQLGDGTTDERHLPRVVKNPAGNGPLGNVVQISADDAVTCAVLGNGQVRCWGDNEVGAVGDGSIGNDRLRPRPVVGVSAPGLLSQISQVEVGGYHVCARTTNGQARCWGSGEYGELGNDSGASNVRPVVVRAATGSGPLSGVRRISASYYHSCAVLGNNQARCWGYNGYGELGDGTEDDRNRPVVVRNAGDTGPLAGVTYLDTGAYHSCALITGGQVRCWGENDYDEVGNGIESGPNVLLPTAVRNRLDTGNLAGVRNLQATDYHTCVTLNNGEARCWGYDSYGALGNGGTDQSPLPVIFSS
jgi:alpha-tubulin suppressor-like RCC1 family protein